jgi:hypothetical protein
MRQAGVTPCGVTATPNTRLSGPLAREGSMSHVELCRTCAGADNIEDVRHRRLGRRTMSRKAMRAPRCWIRERSATHPEATLYSVARSRVRPISVVCDYEELYAAGVLADSHHRYASRGAGAGCGYGVSQRNPTLHTITPENGSAKSRSLREFSTSTRLNRPGRS